MWKTGIWRSEQLKNGDAGWLRRPLALGLLAVNEAASAEEIRRFEVVQPSVRTGEGIYRTTYRNRMPDVNRWALEWLRKRGSASGWRAADWAASDCLAASEWAEELLREWPGSVLTASDLLLEIHEWKSGEEAYYVQPDGTGLQYVKAPFVIPLGLPVRAVYVWNRRLQERAKREMPRFGKAAGEEWEQAGKRWTRRRLSLVHPEARQRKAADGRFRIEQHSLFDRASEPVEALRTMNILNGVYMDRGTMERGVAAIHGSLVEGGLWIVGRTTEEQSKPVNQVSFYERRGPGFEKVGALNQGSELDGWLSEWRAAR